MRLVIIIIFLSTTMFARAGGDYLFVEGSSDLSKKWTHFSQNDELNLRNLLQKLAKSKIGKSLILKASKKAKSYGKTLFDLIEEGNGSITDTTLIRRFTPSSPDKVSYETRSKVYINRNLNQYDALLDLAHELTHFVYREGFNPYNKDFSLSDFIKSTVEGTGGEVQAFMTECRVLYQLFPKKITSRYNCKKIINPESGKLSRTLAVKRFYALGPYYSKFINKLENRGIEQDFNQITNDGVSFISSAYGMPYPVAAYHEYVNVITKVCENDKKRIAYMGRSSGIERSPSSIRINQVKQDYLDRCSAVDSSIN